jgi:hypothetical protein
MFRTAKHILAVAVVIGTAAVPSTALADTAPSSHSATTFSQIKIIKTVNASSARPVQNSVTDSVAASDQFLGLERDGVITARARLTVRKAGKDQLLNL